MRKKMHRMNQQKGYQRPEVKNCYLCDNDIKKLDYKDVILLRRFINTVGKIIPSRRTGTCAKHQRALTKSVKRARIIGLLPFVAR